MLSVTYATGYIYQVEGGNTATMKLHHNQREYTRSTVSIAATLTPEAGEPFGIEVVDLSMGGIFIHTDKPLKNGLKCKISMLLGHFQHELPIVADAEVIRTLSHGIALKFQTIELESVANIQNLIVEHAEEPDQAALEFSSHGGWIFTP